MAKTKPTHRPDGKQARTISTTGIFKKRESDTTAGGGRKGLVGSGLPPLSKKRKHKLKPEHWLSKEFSGRQSSLQKIIGADKLLLESVEDARKQVESTIISELDSARDGLITQAQSTLRKARDRVQEVDVSTDDMTKPLLDEVLELTRKDGSVITSTLGKRMKAYREMVIREQKTLDALFEQWADVSRQIDDWATKHSGPRDATGIMSNSDTNMAESDTTDQRGLVARLEAERKRVLDAAAAAGEKAMRAVKANEKVRQPVTLKQTVF
ncbi:MAG: hypothetical protein L6R39_001099 [Caloplaca ligustica]|nr:MAG: hypothetical protein L6R39_001099 [Caloplaca ligustica]